MGNRFNVNNNTSNFKNINVGSGYGATGVTISTAGALQMNGKLTVDGDISGSLTSTGSFGRVEAIGVISADDLNVTDDLSVGGDSNIGTLLNFKQNNEATIKVLGAGGGNVHGVDLIISGANASTEGSARDGGDVIIASGRKGGAGAEGNILLNPHQGLVGIATLTPTVALQVAGNISSSGAINTLSHITASGNISASGMVTALGYNNISSSQGLISPVTCNASVGFDVPIPTNP